MMIMGAAVGIVDLEDGGGSIVVSAASSVDASMRSKSRSSLFL